MLEHVPSDTVLDGILIRSIVLCNDVLAQPIVAVVAEVGVDGISSPPYYRQESVQVATTNAATSNDAGRVICEFAGARSYRNGVLLDAVIQRAHFESKCAILWSAKFWAKPNVGNLVTLFLHRGVDNVLVLPILVVDAHLVVVGGL